MEYTNELAKMFRALLAPVVWTLLPIWKMLKMAGIWGTQTTHQIHYQNIQFNSSVSEI